MTDLLRAPVIGRFLKQRHARTLLQIPLFIVSVLMVVHGLFGPTLAPKNLATVLSWVHFRGALVLMLLCAGNFFCLACPFMLVRNFARKFFQPVLQWPRALRNKWLSVGLFVAVLFSYELFDLWSSAWWTAWLIIAYFATALLVDALFKHASFCKFVCPIGQFNFVASLVSPLEVKVREPEVCDECATKDCIKGRKQGLVTIRRGCELALFQPLKVGNMDCTFCLDCVQACPHDNVGVLSREPGEELANVDAPRSGVGVLGRRVDISALGIVFTFGALLNAFGMVSPVYALEAWLGRALHASAEAPVLGVIFGLFLVVEPILLLGVAAWLTRAWAQSKRGWMQLIVRHTYGLVPMGFGMWLAHYSFHFLTGLLTVIPVVQSALGFEAQWRLTGLPVTMVHPIELGFLLLGLAGSLLVSFQLAEDDGTPHLWRAFTPWACVGVALFAASVWLILQPMEMRGMVMGG